MTLACWEQTAALRQKQTIHNASPLFTHQLNLRYSSQVIRLDPRAPDQVAIAVRHSHRDKVLPPDNIGWIIRIEIGGVDGSCRDALNIRSNRFATRKLKRVGAEHTA